MNVTEEMIEAGMAAASITMEHDSELGSVAWLDNLEEIFTTMLAAAPVTPKDDAQPVHRCQKCFGAGAIPTRLPGEGETEYRNRCKEYTRSDAGEVDRLLEDVLNFSARMTEADIRCAGLRAELGECKGEYDRAVNKVDALREALSAARNDLLAVAHLVPGDYIQKSVASAEVVIAEPANKESAQ